MYNIFSTNSRAPKRLQEGEPPPKKLQTEGDRLIKKLVENQMKTRSTLVEELTQKKEFTPSQSFTSATGHVKGETSLQKFQLTLNDVAERNRLKDKGLTDRDIEIYREFCEMGPQFWTKYKAINKEMLEKRLNAIHYLVQETGLCEAISQGTVSRHETDYISAVKPQSLETKLLKFATLNKPKTSLCGLMDQLPVIEKQFVTAVEEFSKCDLRKIRKTARSLGRRVERLNRSNSNTMGCAETAHINRKTLWDVKQPPTSEAKVQIVDKSRVYSCKPENLYTIKDGNIIKLNPDRSLKEKTVETGTQLTLNEIRNIAKFSNYEAGRPSNVLFLKNMNKLVSEDFLSSFLKKHELQAMNIKVMTGKMKGQCFIDFTDVAQATRGLDALNGVLINDRPIIAQFGKKNC